MSRPLTWEVLRAMSARSPESWQPTAGPACARSRLRLFGAAERDVRVTLFRDNHAWCPYCQKIWLWLEEKQVPYRVEKVTMFCYGEKETWYKRVVPSGMLPALKLDSRVVTESDVIMQALETAFGPLGPPMRALTHERQLERNLFGAWCGWLCRANSGREEARAQAAFEQAAQEIERALRRTRGPWLAGDEFSSADVILVPYAERMAASLYFYKGYDKLRDGTTFPNFAKWFDALETRAAYRGTQSDFHTHVHDLPPQMGGCYSNGSVSAQENARRVLSGPFAAVPDCSYGPPEDARLEAVFAVCRHADKIVAANAVDCPTDDLDLALRGALTDLLRQGRLLPEENKEPHQLSQQQAAALLYVRDRVNVPRDMGLWPARHLREALSNAANRGRDDAPPSPPIAKNHRKDQDPKKFHKAGA